MSSLNECGLPKGHTNIMDNPFGPSKNLCIIWQYNIPLWNTMWCYERDNVICCCSLITILLLLISWHNEWPYPASGHPQPIREQHYEYILIILFETMFRCKTPQMHVQPSSVAKYPGKHSIAHNSFLPYGKIIDFQLSYQPCYWYWQQQ